MNKSELVKALLDGVDLERYREALNRYLKIRMVSNEF